MAVPPTQWASSLMRGGDHCGCWQWKSRSPLPEFPWEEPTFLPRPPHYPSFFYPLPVPPTIEQGADGSGALVSRPGELVTMACPVRGSPPIHVSWLKDGLPLPLSQRTFLHGSGRTLR